MCLRFFGIAFQKQFIFYDRNNARAICHVISDRIHENVLFLLSVGYLFN